MQKFDEATAARLEAMEEERRNQKQEFNTYWQQKMA